VSLGRFSGLLSDRVGLQADPVMGRFVEFFAPHGIGSNEKSASGRKGALPNKDSKLKTQKQEIQTSS
jgi:hypothetical protein